MTAPESTVAAGKRTGRPLGTKRTNRTATIPPIRCTPPQREAFDAAGGAKWLRAQLDRHARRQARAKEPA